MTRYRNEYERWLQFADKDTVEELKSLEGQEEQIEYRFSKNLDFGTAGLRGVMMAGLNAMNVYTVGAATKGLAEYIKDLGAADRGVLIGCDSRIHSAEFSKVAAEVLKPEVMKASFLVADDQEVLAFEAAIQRKCFHVAEDEWNTLEWLNDMGYLVSYSDDYAEVPAEVAAVYDQINTPEFRTLRSQVNWLKDCLIMVSYLYVSAPAKTVYEMFKQRKGFDIGYDRFIELYHTIPEKACICELAGDQLILKSALVNNIYKDIERRQGGRKFYIPSVDEILDYSENGYPTKSASYQRLGRFLLDEIKVSDAVKDQVLFFIYKECSMDGRMSAIMENLNQKGIQFNDEQLEKFTKLIMEANNNTRMLEFRGYTPNEISGAVWPFATGKPHTAMPNSFVPTAMPMQPASARKIYPNDPCPCGSGKKYKKCCGKNK